MLDVDDENRKIKGSKRYPDKTLKEIAQENADYLLWYATKSKAGLPDKYACARIYLGQPFVCHVDGEIVEKERYYKKSIEIARGLVK